MITKLSISALIVLTLFFLLGSCKLQPTPPNLEIKLAPIHEVKISYAKSNPPQVLVTIKGGLPDGCSKFYDVSYQITGKTVDIKVTIERPRDAVCTAIYGYFDQTVNLGSNFTKGDEYTVNVNDQTTTFIMQ